MISIKFIIYLNNLIIFVKTRNYQQEFIYAGSEAASQNYFDSLLSHCLFSSRLLGLGSTWCAGSQYGVDGSNGGACFAILCLVR